MGNSQGDPKEKYGDIFVQTDKPFYLAGDTVSGHVYANIYKSYPSKNIFLKFKGKEVTWWRESYR